MRSLKFFLTTLAGLFLLVSTSEGGHGKNKRAQVRHSVLNESSQMSHAPFINDGVLETYRHDRGQQYPYDRGQRRYRGDRHRWHDGRQWRHRHDGRRWHDENQRHRHDGNYRYIDRGHERRYVDKRHERNRHNRDRDNRRNRHNQHDGNRNTYVLYMEDVFYRSKHHDSTVDLKSLIEQRYNVSSSSFRNIDLRRVEVRAKSRHGRGSVALVVGGSRRDSETLRGNPDDWHDKSRRSYDEATLDHYGGSSGNWTLEFRGNIKVKKITVHVDRDSYNDDYDDDDYDYRDIYNFSLGSRKIEKTPFKRDQYLFRVHRTNVVSVKITCTKHHVRINSATLILSNGRRKELYGLNGVYRDGESQDIDINPRNVRELIIDAVSPYYNGSRGIINYNGSHGIIKVDMKARY